jgi:hypothetical protein
VKGAEPRVPHLAGITPANTPWLRSSRINIVILFRHNSSSSNRNAFIMGKGAAAWVGSERAFLFLVVFVLEDYNSSPMNSLGAVRVCLVC